MYMYRDIQCTNYMYIMCNIAIDSVAISVGTKCHMNRKYNRQWGLQRITGNIHLVLVHISP